MLEQDLYVLPISLDDVLNSVYLNRRAMPVSRPARANALQYLAASALGARPNLRL
jgi:hypothetical protein